MGHPHSQDHGVLDSQTRFRSDLGPSIRSTPTKTEVAFPKAGF